MKYAIKQPTSMRDAIKDIAPDIRRNKLGARYKNYDGLLMREVRCVERRKRECAALHLHLRPQGRWR